MSEEEEWEYEEEEEEEEEEDPMEEEYNHLLRESSRQVERKLPYEVLSKTQILEKQELLMKELQQVTGLAPSASRAVLQKFQWDKMKALDEWGANPTAVCKMVGLPPPDSSSLEKAPVDNPLECTICFMEADSEDQMSVMNGCGHRFCMGCWNSYLKKEVKEKNKHIVCPGYLPKSGKCKMIVDELLVVKLLDDPEAQKRFYESLMNSFVEENPMVKWCPRPNCEYALVLTESNQEHNEVVECLCGKRFCFRCSEEEHQPATCDMAKEWSIKNSGNDTSLDMQLIASISRPCPRCKAHVQKNGGCNHMNCTQCQYHFCWHCMQKFGSGPDGGNDGYQTHQCNAFYEEDLDVKSSKTELKRFQWYSQRFNNHVKSINYSQKDVAESGNMIGKIISEFNCSWVHAQFYLLALQQIIKNRVILKASYIFGFYRPFKAPHVNKLIFENIQNDLEAHTEQLSKLVENRTPIELWKDQDKIRNQTTVASKVAAAVLSAASDWNNPLPVSSITKPKQPKKEKKPAKPKLHDWMAEEEEEDDDEPYDPRNDDLDYEEQRKLREQNEKEERERKQREEERQRREEERMKREKEEQRKKQQEERRRKEDEELKKVLEESKLEYEKSLRVDDIALGTLLSMGFGIEEATLALKNTKNNVEHATEWLLNH